MRDQTKCKQCDGDIKVVHALDIYSYPYIPDWPLERHDSGRFCSLLCIYNYAEAVDA